MEGPVTKAVLAVERKKSHQLGKELRRKEKALAEMGRTERSNLLRLLIR